MRYELSTPMVFGSAGFGPGSMNRREAHFADGDCRACGGVCKQPALAAQPPEPKSKRRYPKLMRARVVDVGEAKKPGLTPRRIDAE